jgi:hypothetical protein
MQRWTVEQAWAWSRQQPWLFGANLIPDGSFLYPAEEDDIRACVPERRAGSGEGR